MCHGGIVPRWQRSTKRGRPRAGGELEVHTEQFHFDFESRIWGTTSSGDSVR
jgi:hypothetical protein